MAEKAMFPEKRFLRAVFPGEFSEQCLAIPFALGAEAVLEELRERIGAALEGLSYRDRGIIEMRYGFGDGYFYTLAEAGEVFRLTRERIRQLQARALRKLRSRGKALREFVSNLDT
jgi:RNA polymerase sigma factor (sigma-70 family)